MRRLRRAVATAGVLFESLDYSSFDGTHDRIAQLERELGRLKKQLRQSRYPAAVDAYNASAATRKR
ncbi:hypothetical protein [Sphingomonas sp.]|uniref:hypothetical protein n=1 Tax=Sphingomonas sp. TaxID=28214 RepID=UPI0035A84D93